MLKLRRLSGWCGTTWKVPLSLYITLNLWDSSTWSAPRKPTLVLLELLAFPPRSLVFPLARHLCTIARYLYCREVIKKTPSLASSGGGSLTLGRPSLRGFSLAWNKAGRSREPWRNVIETCARPWLPRVPSRSVVYVSSCVCPPHSIKSK